MFGISSAKIKDKTYLVKGGQYVLSPIGNASSNFFNYCKFLFNISDNLLSNNSGRTAIRVGTSLHVSRVFNFSRVELTHVLNNGLRTFVPSIDINHVYTSSNGITSNSRCTEDLSGLMHLFTQRELLRDNVVICNFHRIVVPTKQQLQESLRCLHLDDADVAKLERSTFINTENITGNYLSLDFVTITIIDGGLFGQEINVMETLTNQMFSRRSLTDAPAHILDNSGVAIHTPSSLALSEEQLFDQTLVSGSNYERSIVSNCKIVIHDAAYERHCPIRRWTWDCGRVIYTPVVIDTTVKEGIYKEWHFIKNGKLTIETSWHPLKDITAKLGYYLMKQEAIDRKPKNEIEEIYVGFNSALDSFENVLKTGFKELLVDVKYMRRDLTKEITKSFENTLEKAFKVIAAKVSERTFEEKSKQAYFEKEIKSLKEELNAARTELLKTRNGFDSFSKRTEDDNRKSEINRSNLAEDLRRTKNDISDKVETVRNTAGVLSSVASVIKTVSGFVPKTKENTS